jgi:GNAT superfamily N-acetyltransferase
VKLRHPNPGDVDALVRLARAMHLESWYAGFDFSEAKVRRFIDEIMEASHFLALIAEDRDSQIVGFFVAAEMEHYFGNDRYACDVCTYVAPDARGSVAFKRMIAAYEAWCRIRNVKEIHVGFSSGVTLDKVQRYYQRLGYASPLMAWRKKCVWPV